MVVLTLCGDRTNLDELVPDSIRFGRYGVLVLTATLFLFCIVGKEQEIDKK